MAFPMPVWSNADIKMAREVVRNPSSLTWNTWNKDPTKLTVLRAMASCQVRLGRAGYFGWDMVNVLAKKLVRFLHSYLLDVEEVH